MAAGLSVKRRDRARKYQSNQIFMSARIQARRRPFFQGAKLEPMR